MKKEPCEKLLLPGNFAQQGLRCHNDGQQHQLLSDGLADYPDQNVPVGHGLFICNSGLTHLIRLQSTGTAHNTSAPSSLTCEVHPCWRKSLEEALFMTFLQCPPEWKSLPWFCYERKMGFFVWVSKWKSCLPFFFFFPLLLTGRISFICLLNLALHGKFPPR